MKKVGFILLLSILTILPCNAKPKFEMNRTTGDDTIVFVYHIPDEEENLQKENAAPQQDEPVVITSDDVTADTSGVEEETEYEDDNDIADGEYHIGEMYTDVLKGYAEYNEEEENALSLEDFEDNYLTLQIKRPAKVAQEAYTSLRSPDLKFNEGNRYSKYTAPEYRIEPMSSTNYRTVHGFSAGTLFDQCIDYGELEQTSGVFSRYDTKYFAFNTAYKKTVNSTNNNYNDNFYFSPELKLNQYFTLIEVFSADITRNTKKAEFILSINPLGNRDIDRLRFELGASQIYNNTNAVLKNQFRFSTKFQL